MGNVPLQIKSNFQLEKVEIQIKTLPNSELDSPKYQCDKPFLSHCETSLLPVILIPVNAKSELAYWLHLDREILEDLGKRIKGESIVVHIPKENIITRDDTKYIEEWTTIVETYIRKRLIPIHKRTIKRSMKNYISYLKVSQDQFTQSEKII